MYSASDLSPSPGEATSHKAVSSGGIFSAAPSSTPHAPLYYNDLRIIDLGHISCQQGKLGAYYRHHLRIRSDNHARYVKRTNMISC